MIPKLTDEMSLITNIRSCGIECRAFDGLTTPDQRREIVRKALLANSAQERFGGDFARVYGEAL